MKRCVSFFLTIVLTSHFAFAEKMDVATHTALIEKLKAVVDLSEEGVSKQNLRQRLADLHSERARLYAMEQEGKGDQIFKKEIAADRASAIAMYQQVLQTADNANKPKILLQMAQLNHLQGRSETSKKLYLDIVKNQKKYSNELVAQAYIELGEYDYYNQKFTAAKKNYENALQFKEAPRVGYVKYRLAWVEFQNGNTRTAIHKMVAVLSNPELLKRKDGSLDQSFQEEASRDLATFYARQDVSQSDLDILTRLSPANTKNTNLTYLATELDRTGKKKGALLVWALLGTHKRSDEDKLEGQIKIARIQYDLNKKEQAVKEISIAAKMLRESDCDDKAQCLSLQQQLKSIVTDWGKAEEREPTTQLIFAYKAYLEHFSDLEMNYWAGIAASKRKIWNEAYQFYKKSSELAYEQIHDKKDKSGAKQVNIIFEGSLLGAIESAEQAKDLQLRNEAYNHYLRLNPKGEKSIEVEYQIAQLFLERGENEKAANKFKEVALRQTGGSQSIKDKAADLALDTLVLLKDDRRIEEWALEFSKELPHRKTEFLTIARKSIINQAANVINQSKSNSDLEKQYSKLLKTDLSKATTDERINFQKHKLILVTKLKNIPEIIVVASQLLQEKSLKESDVRDTKLQLVWAYEMKLEFKSALNILKTIEPSKAQKEDHILKLAVLSELAGLNPTAYYEEFLSISRDRLKKQEVALTLVRIAKNKTKAFAKYKEHLQARSFVEAGLFAYDEKRSESLKKEILNKTNRNSFEAQLLLREQAIKDMEENARILAKHKISKNQSQLKRSLDERLKLIQKMEVAANRAIDTKDFTLQFLSLSVIATENDRLARDIKSLPQPKGLNAEMKKQYNALLEQQIAPYVEKAKQVKKKVDELWTKREDSNFKEVIELSTQTETSGNKVALEEVYAVTRMAKRLKYDIKGLAQKPLERQKLSQELTQLKTKVQKNPYDSNNLEKMKEIEKRLGRGAMVAYLDARLSKLKAGGQN